MSTSRNVVLAGPSSLLQVQPSSTCSSSSGEKATRFLLLPHPRTRAATYYLPHVSESSHAGPSSSSASSSTREKGDTESSEKYDGTDSLLELQVVRPDNAKRSWFLGGRRAGQQEQEQNKGAEDTDSGIGEGLVVSDGALHLLSPVEPISILLPLLSVILSSSPVPFLPASDIFETAATKLYSERARNFNASLRDEKGKGKDGGAGAKGKAPPVINSSSNVTINDERVPETGVWEDIVRFGKTDVARRALSKVCETQALDEETMLLRPSEPLILSHLLSRHERLSARTNFENLPLTLGRQIAREFESWDPSPWGNVDAGLDPRVEEKERPRYQYQDAGVDGKAPPAFTPTSDTHQRLKAALQIEEAQARRKIATELMAENLPREWVEKLEAELGKGGLAC